MEGWKKISHANGNDKKVEVAILVLDKIDFKTVYNKRQRRESYNDKGINTRRGYNIC